MIAFYLAHNFYDRKMLRKWELKLETKYNISLANPFYDNDRNDIKELDKLKDRSKEQREYLRKRDIDLIVEGDLEMIRKSDGVVTMLNSPSFGTPMEIFFASKVLHIPVYIITKKYTYHPWIRKYATKIFKNRTEFESFVKQKYGLRTGLDDTTDS